jgi:hypothetical protein
VGVVIEMTVTAEATKVIEVLTATEEEVVAVFVSTRKTEGSSEVAGTAATSRRDRTQI